MAQNFQNPYNFPDLSIGISLPSYNGLTPQLALDYYLQKPMWLLTLQQLASLEDNANPYVPVDEYGNGLYAGDARGIDLLNGMHSNILVLADAFNQLLKKAESMHWWTSRKKQRERLGALKTEGDRLNLSLEEYNNMIQLLGLEGTVPSLEDYSKETLNLTIEESELLAASKRATSLENLKTKGSEYAGAAFDIASNLFTDNPKAYDGKQGNLTLSIDAAGDSISDAAMASGNPYAMMGAAAYKAMGFLNRAIGGGTDGMTKTDAILDSNLGFAFTGGLSKLNGALGSTTDKFEVDRDLQATMSGSYQDTYGDLGDAASVAGKRYGFLSGRARRKAQHDIRMAEQRQNTIADINEESLDRLAAGYYEGTGFRNQMNLNGGFKSMRAARKGIKFNLDFAHKVARALKGIRFNRFNMVTSEGPKLQNSEDAPLNASIQIEEPKDVFTDLSEADLNALGIKYIGNTEGIITYLVGTQELADRLNGNDAFKNRLKSKYNASDVIFLYLALNLSSLSPLLSAPELETQVDTLQSGQSQESSTEDSSEESSQGVEEPAETNIEEEGLAEEPVEEETTESSNNVNPVEETPILNIGSSPYTSDNPRPSYGIIDYNTLSQLIPIALNGDLESFRLACLQYNPNMSPQGIAELYTDLLRGTLNLGLLEPRDPSIINLGVPLLKNGGVFTFMPYTDELVTKFKEGGSFNVIPDGALHKNRHNMEDAEGLTKKGIPVVTEEDGKKVQQAEIEVNEIIFRLEVTEKLEKLAKEGTDEAALEAGKLITDEILHNTHDNTGLIKETV